MPMFIVVATPNPVRSKQNAGQHPLASWFKAGGSVNEETTRTKLKIFNFASNCAIVFNGAINVMDDKYTL